MYRAVIVDDHAILRDSFASAFRGAGYDVIGELSDAAEVPAFCRDNHPDLAVMDVCTENGSSGLDAAEEIIKTMPEDARPKLIMMSGFDEISYVPRARSVGADAFVYKTKSMDWFLEVTRRVLDGEKCFPEPVTIPLLDGETPLTDREMEVMRCVCRYMPRAEIAKELFISENTVKFHIKNMLRKTGTSSVAELAILMISNGWINPRF